MSVCVCANTLTHFLLPFNPPSLPVSTQSSITTSLIHDGQTFAFDGFSLWSTVPLEHVANCTFVRFGHQHTARLVREAALEGQPPGVEEMLLLQEYIFVELLELYDWVRGGFVYDWVRGGSVYDWVRGGSVCIYSQRRCNIAHDCMYTHTHTHTHTCTCTRTPPRAPTCAAHSVSSLSCTARIRPSPPLPSPPLQPFNLCPGPSSLCHALPLLAHPTEERLWRTA